jgi:putative transposase
MTPAAIHHGQAGQLHAARAAVLEAAYARTPERFVRKPPAPPELPTAARINKPKEVAAAHQFRTRSVSPGLTGSARGN